MTKSKDKTSNRSIIYTDLNTGETKNMAAEIAKTQQPSQSALVPALPQIPATTIEAWKRAPQEEATRQALLLFQELGCDITEQRLKFEIIKFVAELHGALEIRPQQVQQTVVKISIEACGRPEPRRIIDVQAQEKKKDSALQGGR